jgi:uncharacterized protein DUF4350
VRDELVLPAPVIAELAVDEPLEGGFSRRALAWIIGSVAVSFIAAILLGVYGKDLDRRPNVRANTFSYSALGYKAVAELLKSLGLVVRSRQVQAGGVGPHVPLILAEPEEPDSVHLHGLSDEAKDRAAPLVLVLPKWLPGAAREDKPDWLARVDLLNGNDVLRRVRALRMPELDKLGLARFSGKPHCGAAWRSGEPPAVDIQTAQFFTGLVGGLQPLVRCDGGILVAWRPATEESPQLVLISDPDLLNNHGLGRGDNAAVVFELLTRSLGATGVVFDETIHGFHRKQGLLAEALGFPMVLGVVQGLVLLGVVLWAGMGRFGKPLPPPAPLAAGKEILIDNTAQMLSSGGHAADCLARYFRQTTRAVAAHYFLPPDLPDGERLARLQRITGARGGKVSLAELERSVWQLPDSRPGEEPAAAIARRLHDWRVEMTNGHRESP